MDPFLKEMEKKECILVKKRHNMLLNELQNMCCELDPAYQQRLPNDLLTNLANSLLDKTVFDIVKGLKDIQTMTETNLFTSRIRFINNQKAQLKALLQRHQEELTQQCLKDPSSVHFLKIRQEKELEELKKYEEEELNRFDMKIILELDQVVSDQQSTLDRAGVPGFVLSNKEVDIKLQMNLLNFILKLSKKETEF